MATPRNPTHGGKRAGSGRKRLAPATKRAQRLTLKLRAAEKAAFTAAAKAQGKPTATWAVEELNQATGGTP